VRACARACVCVCLFILALGINRTRLQLSEYMTGVFVIYEHVFCLLLLDTHQTERSAALTEDTDNIE